MMKKIVYVICGFLLSGCFGGYSPESRFYTLQSVENVEKVSNKNISVGVDLPELPEYADRPQFVSFSVNGSKINIDELNRWGEDLDIMLQRVIAADLRSYLPNANVKANTSLLEKFRYIVDVTITKFEMIEDSEAYLEALWSIKNGSSLNILRKGKTSLNMKIEDETEGYSLAMSEMIAQMSGQIAKSLVGL